MRDESNEASESAADIQPSPTRSRAKPETPAYRRT
jgi:hypothetical protein